MAYIEKFIAEGREYFNSRCDRDIERYRKGDFTVKVLHDGCPAENAKVTFDLKKLDFELGCNIFMLEQYDDKQAQETYEKLWLKLFNTAVIPLYWEGTEPKPGYLRYDKDTPNDVYRRPPASCVVEFCRKHELNMKGHPLFWQEFIPKWLPEDWNELLPLIEKRFREISERYADIIPVFDSVNEPSRLFDQLFEYIGKDWKCIHPPKGYIEQIFESARKYFPHNTLVLNEATDAAFCEFRGPYGGYLLLLEKLLNKGVSIDRIGLQCHCGDNPRYKNIFNAQRLYHVLDGYAELGKPLVVSEIGMSSADEELQAAAAEQMYKVCFSHPSMSGVFWWNLDDNGVLCDKQRNAEGENLPYSGIVRNGRPKAAYKALDRLINREWTTNGSAVLSNGRCEFRGFYGTYNITVEADGVRKTVAAKLIKDCRNAVEIEI